MTPRLKVFTWSDGFHAFTVAASSRPKALAAWGVGQDLFATGLARELDDGPDYAAAKAAPGQVIERGLSVDPGKMAGKRRPTHAAAKSTAAQKRRIAALETELEAMDAAHAKEDAAGLAEIEALHGRRDAAAKAHARARRALLAKLKAARDRTRP